MIASVRTVSRVMQDDGTYVLRKIVVVASVVPALPIASAERYNTTTACTTSWSGAHLVVLAMLTRRTTPHVPTHAVATLHLRRTTHHARMTIATPIWIHAI